MQAPDETVLHGAGRQSMGVVDSDIGGAGAEDLVVLEGQLPLRDNLSPQRHRRLIISIIEFGLFVLGLHCIALFASFMWYILIFLLKRTEDGIVKGGFVFAPHVKLLFNLV